MQDFMGRVAVITGGGAGIGAAMARRFAKEGMKLVLSDINEAALNQVVSELRTQGAEVEGVPVDVSDRAQIEALAEAALAGLGAPHLLCANVGLIMFDALENTSDAIWQTVWSTNVMGSVNLVNAFLPCMKELQGERHITLTSSMYGFVTAPRIGAYTAGKYALTGYGETLKTELAEYGIGVTLIFPTMVGTEHLKNSTGVIQQDIAGHRVKEDDVMAYLEVASSHCERFLPPDDAVRNLVDDIRHNRLYSVTHDGPVASFRKRSNELLAAMARADR